MGADPITLPFVTLHDPQLVPFDLMGFAGIRYADMDDDGVLDFLASSPSANLGSTPNAGIVQVFSGADLTGPPLRRLIRPTPINADQLARRATTIADIDGDGLLDVVTLSPYTDTNGTLDTGSVNVFSAGETHWKEFFHPDSRTAEWLGLY